ncbi:MAG: ABC transporter ATP-binding protein [Chloroflexota bacterium]
MKSILSAERTTTALEAVTTTSSGIIIDIAGLSVFYGDVKAVRGVNLQVEHGEIFGLLGPNGAGKTTMLSAIEGIVKPTAGRVIVLGRDVQKQTEEVQRTLGISLQSTAFFDELKLWELVKLYAGMYEVFLSKSEILALLARFDLAEKANALTRQLSGGQQQRMALALAICNDPQIVILDEPTTGLDPQARRAVWAIIRELRAEGRTVVLTTHYMEEAQELCHRIGIIDRGELIALDTPAGLIRSLKADSLISTTIRLPESEVEALPGVTGVRWEGDHMLVQTNDAQETVFGLQKLAVEHRQLLTDLTIKQPDLEDVFIALTGRNIRQ